MDTETPAPFFARDPMPLDISFGSPARQSRVTVAFRILIAIPHLVVLWVLEVIGGLLAIVGWFAALALGRLPRWIARYQMGLIAYSIRVNSYVFLVAGKFPPFGFSAVDYSIGVRIGASRLSRIKVFFRLLLCIPAAIVSSIAQQGLTVFSLITWLVTLVRGQTPQAMFGAAAAVIRYQARLHAYVSLVTDVYPRRLFGDDESVWTSDEQDSGRDFRLRLSTGAHRLMVLIILLGVAAVGANIVLQVRLQRNVSALVAAERDLQSASQNFAISFAACASLSRPLHCHESSEAAWGQAFDEFGSSLSRVSFSGPDGALAAALEQQAHTVASTLRRASVAKTVDENQQAFLQAQIVINQFDADQRALFGTPR